MSEQHGKKYPQFLFLQRGQRGSAEIKVPLGLGESIFSFLIQLWRADLHPGGGHMEMVTPETDLHYRQASQGGVVPGRSERDTAGPMSPNRKGPARQRVWRGHRAGDKAWALLWFMLPVYVAYWV